MKLDYIRDILVLAQKCRRVYEKKCIVIMKKYDLRFSDLDILYFLSIAGDRNLAKNLVDKGMSKANVSMSVENLKRERLIESEEDEEDRRCLRIHLTEKALPILKEVIEVKKKINNILFDGITEEDSDTLISAIVKMDNNIQKEFMETL